MQTKKDFSELADLVRKNGEVCIGFVHQFYGPLRSLSFFIKDTNPEYIAGYLDSVEKWGPIATEIWEATALATQPLILPAEVYEKAETPIKTFSTFKMAHKHIQQLLKSNPDIRQDPYFYRLGKI